MNYKHIYYKCGCIIGMRDCRKGFVCEKCGEKYSLWKLDFDWLALNDKTGWQFPMKKKTD